MAYLASLARRTALANENVPLKPRSKNFCKALKIRAALCTSGKRPSTCMDHIGCSVDLYMACLTFCISARRLSKSSLCEFRAFRRHRKRRQEASNKWDTCTSTPNTPCGAAESASSNHKISSLDLGGRNISHTLSLVGNSKQEIAIATKETYMWCMHTAQEHEQQWQYLSISNHNKSRGGCSIIKRFCSNNAHPPSKQHSSDRGLLVTAVT